jgi:hypothetical protein
MDISKLKKIIKWLNLGAMKKNTNYWVKKF